MRTESVGPAPAVIETDGSIEQSDSLKVAYEGAPETGLDVFRHSFDDVLDEPLIRQRQAGADGLGPACGRCPLVAVCGGGLFAHRYAAGSGFRNPSGLLRRPGPAHPAHPGLGPGRSRRTTAGPARTGRQGYVG
ncbi:hypothetical protein OG272_42175 [Streptomyces sp. NBC_00104]|uniref:hypothetical protein n=1 Tax=Streptomyces sp. NBC_00104 TaxID=2903621 RepID=UPI003244281D